MLPRNPLKLNRYFLDHFLIFLPIFFSIDSILIAQVTPHAYQHFHARRNNFSSDFSKGLNYQRIIMSSKLDSEISDFKFESDLIHFVIPLKLFQWQRFTVILGDDSATASRTKSVKHEGWSRNWNWSFNSEDKNFMLMKRYYGADIEITEMRKLFPSLTTTRNSDHDQQDESLAMMHSTSQQQLHFICFVQPNEFLLLISKVPNFISQSWLFLVSSTNENQTLLEWSRMLEKFPINIDSDFFIGIYDKIQHRYKLNEFFRICDSCGIQTSFVCTIHLNEISVFEGDNCDPDKYHRRQNLNGITISGVGVNVSTFDVDAQKMENDSWILKGGAYGEVFEILRQELNFKAKVTILEGYKYGKFDPVNKTWDGIIGTVYRGDADMSINPLSVTAERLGYFDFSIAMNSVGVRIYIQRTLEKKSIQWTFYTSPFSPLLHVAVLTCSMSLALILWGFLEARPLKDTDFTLYETAWIILAALCQKGSHMTPTSPSAKAIFLVAYLTCLIIYCGYSATLTSQLSVPQPLQLPFRDLRGLTHATGWTGGPIKGDFTYNTMQKTCPDILAKSGNNTNSQCELLTQAWTKVVAPIESSLPSNFEEGLRRVLREHFAFITTMTGARSVISTQLTDQEACGIHEMSAEALSSNLAFALKKNLTIRKLINYKLLRLYQAGVLSQIRRRWLPMNKNCLNAGTGVTDATLFDVAVAPLLVLFGLFSSGLLLIVECWWGCSFATNKRIQRFKKSSSRASIARSWSDTGSSRVDFKSESRSSFDSQAERQIQLQPSSQAMNIGKDFYQTDNKMKWVFH